MTDKELLEKAIYWFRVIAEDMERITAGNLPHNAAITKGRAIRAYEFLEKHKGEESTSEDLLEIAMELEETIGTSPHSRLAIVEHLAKAANWQKQRDIDKACEWLRKELAGYIYAEYVAEELTGEACISDNMIEDFRKAMED